MAHKSKNISLSEPQTAAVQWDDGPFLLLAGPGSGKTRVITQRLVRLVTSTPKERFRVLALTFTNRAADEMRTRVVEAEPAAEDRVVVGTFHSFSTDVLRQSGQQLGLRSDFRIYSTESDRQQILQEVISKISVPSRDVLSGIKPLPILDRLAGALADPDKISVKFRDAEMGAAYSELYTAYQKHLINTNSQDFSSLILNAYLLMHRYQTLAARYRKAYRYWSIDEFQDTTSAQFQLIKTAAGKEFRNIFVVADDDQVIYQWNGASYKRLEEFAMAFQPSVLQLPTNYRCPAEVVAIANLLVSHNVLRRDDKKPLLPGRPPSKSKVVRLAQYADEQAEASGIAKLVKAQTPETRKTTVVLARARASLALVKQELESLNVAARIVQRRDAFQSTEFLWLHFTLVLAASRVNENALRDMLDSFNALFATEISSDEVVTDARASEGDYFSAFVVSAQKLKKGVGREVADAMSLLLLRASDYLKFSEFALKIFARNDSIGDENTELDSGYAEDKQAWVSLVRDIRSTVGSVATLEVFLQELQLRSKEAPLGPDQVALMTIHAAKGNEFSHVYLMGLAENMLPSYQSVSKGDKSSEMEEERRNCFVAITRAQTRLELSYAQRYRGYSRKPSRFLYEMELVED